MAGLPVWPYVIRNEHLTSEDNIFISSPKSRWRTVSKLQQAGICLFNNIVLSVMRQAALLCGSSFWWWRWTTVHICARTHVRLYSRCRSAIAHALIRGHALSTTHTHTHDGLRVYAHTQTLTRMYTHIHKLTHAQVAGETNECDYLWRGQVEVDLEPDLSLTPNLSHLHGPWRGGGRVKGIIEKVE